MWSVSILYNPVSTFLKFYIPCRLLEQGYQSDIVFIVHGKSFCAHRCILGARSAYFAEMFETKWKGKNIIALKHPLVRKLLLCFSYFVSSVVHVDAVLASFSPETDDRLCCHKVQVQYDPGKGHDDLRTQMSRFSFLQNTPAPICHLLSAVQVNTKPKCV